ncbi:hypothetical protein L1887_35848 [Cichorium endivia]|nr:hypothetical protein L1887_35848 [Cichorium endivia]
MEVTQVLHMNGGDGDYSYSNNSLVQRMVISMTKPIMEEALTDLYFAMNFPKTLTMADLGCSSGSNTFLVALEFIKILDNIRQKVGHTEFPEMQIYLNDLPHNDFNAIFDSLSKFHQNIATQIASPTSLPPCYFSGVAGSFYTRLFLSNNFLMFLQYRAKEMVTGGRMVLTFLGRRSDDPCSKECCYIWELLAMALNDMVSEGLIEEGKMDSFNIPQYTPCAEEISNEVDKEGSFTINRLDISEVNWDAYADNNPNPSTNSVRGYNVANCMRAVAEPLLVTHFGESIIEEVFIRYKNIITDRMSKEKTEFINVTVSMTRNC